MTRAEAEGRGGGIDPDDARVSWDAEANGAVKTTLSRIGADRAQSLIRRGYVLTMVNSHVLLGYPLNLIPKPETLAKPIAKDWRRICPNAAPGSGATATTEGARWATDCWTGPT